MHKSARVRGKMLIIITIFHIALAHHFYFIVGRHLYTSHLPFGLLIARHQCLRHHPYTLASIMLDARYAGAAGRWCQLLIRQRRVRTCRCFDFGHLLTLHYWSWWCHCFSPWWWPLGWLVKNIFLCRKWWCCKIRKRWVALWFRFWFMSSTRLETRVGGVALFTTADAYQEVL